MRCCRTLAPSTLLLLQYLPFAHFAVFCRIHLVGMTDPTSSEALRQLLYAKQIVLLKEIYQPTLPPHREFAAGMEMHAEPYANPSGGSGYGSSEHSESGKSPLSMSLGFLKTLTEKKGTRGERRHDSDDDAGLC